MMSSELMDEIKRLKSIANVGLLYSTNEYDKERYEELKKITFRLLNKVSGHTIEELRSSFSLATDYPKKFLKK